jgi:nitrite reductase/ring-hydroxylating ferredoxin subunit
VAKHRVGTVDEIPPDGRKIVEVQGRSIGVFNIGGEFYAIRNTCPHQGGALCEGRVTGFIMARAPGDYTYTRRGEIIRCPWHGWEFDIKTGQSWFDPVRTRVRTYAVTVETQQGASHASNGDTSSLNPAAAAPDMEGLAKGPYLAETYEVSVEQQIVYVEIP